MTNKLKRSQSYYQLKYSNHKYSKDYVKSNSKQSLLSQRRGNLLKKYWKTSKLQEILIPASEVNFKRYSSKFSWGTNC